MLFSVIYSIDTSQHERPTRYYPRNRRLFKATEGDEEFEYDDIWGKGHHRKLVALLTREQFERFCQDTGLMAENCETGGSLGAPGLGWGLSPAISFCGKGDDALLDAYVTPLPEVRGKSGRKDRRGFSERDWERLRKLVIRHYG